MNLVDANVLLYAADEQARYHVDSRAWLESMLGGVETLVVPWGSSLAFLRVSTMAGIFRRPLSVEEAAGFLDDVLSPASVITGEPDRHHLRRIHQLLAATGVGGNLVNDAHLAALALQYDATVVSYDNDFGRFPGVRWQRPPAQPVSPGR